VRAQPLVELLSRAIDYAGLYPPAALTMDAAVNEYHAQRAGADSWALGRFVLGVERLAEFAAARAKLGGPPRVWPLSLLAARTTSLPDLAPYAALLRVDAIEAMATTASDVAGLRPLLLCAPELYVEVPVAEPPLESLLDAIKALGARAKIRTGGVTADAIPSAESVARFIHACAARALPFKATAGLHHALRGEYPLTYERGSPRATMFGYLNVFVASALAQRGARRETLTQVLEERAASGFSIAAGAQQLCWQGHCLTTGDVRDARALGIASFGSCSFSEPMAELATVPLARSA
jgi:hypothetical protein